MSQEASQALQAALIAATRDPAHRARVITALRGAEVWAATWPTDPATLRTLTNSHGITALAVFSDERQLEDAAVRYAWLGLDGRVPGKRLHISEAIRAAKRHRAELVVVDIAADHALELDEGEMELVAAARSARPPSYVGMQPVVSRSRPPEPEAEVERVSTHPPAPEDFERKTPSVRPPPSSAMKPTSVTPDPDGHGVSATFGASTTATMRVLSEAPPDAMFDALTEVLREYPEVEWACLVSAERSHGDRGASIALRIDAAFRKHLPEISAKLREASGAHGRPFDVLVLDTPEQMKQARQIGTPFYPWRKEPTRKR